jgi:hypothetical protein
MDRRPLVRFVSVLAQLNSVIVMTTDNSNARTHAFA